MEGKRSRMGWDSGRGRKNLLGPDLVLPSPPTNITTVRRTLTRNTVALPRRGEGTGRGDCHSTNSCRRSKPLRPQLPAPPLGGANGLHHRGAEAGGFEMRYGG